MNNNNLLYNLKNKHNKTTTKIAENFGKKSSTLDVPINVVLAHSPSFLLPLANGGVYVSFLYKKIFDVYG